MRARLHLFEFEDLPWLPERLRQSITNVLYVAHRAFRTSRAWAPKLASVLARTRSTRIVDLGSGGGGPAIILAEELRRRYGCRVSLTLTDRYPSQAAVARVEAMQDPSVEYVRKPVQATDVPEELRGVRTMFASFHHLRPDTGRAILVDAFRKRQSICIFEFTENTLVGVLSYAAVPAVVWALTPLVRPVSWQQLVLTYAIPVLPLLVTWDGVVSHLRTYSTRELEELVCGLQADDYVWEIGRIRCFPFPNGLPYLIGQPAGYERDSPTAKRDRE